MASSNSQGPTPWWQLPENSGKLQNLQSQAPAGYQYDPVAMKYSPTVGSPSDQLTQRSRTQGIQNTGNAEQQSAFNQLSSALSGLNGGGGTNGSGSASGTAVQHPPIQSQFGASYPGAISGIGGAPMSMPAQVSATSGPSADERQASDDATYATAKDSAANTMQAAMRGLTGEMAARGMGGAGYEAGRIGENVMEGANTIGQAERQHAQQQYDKAGQLQSEQLQADVSQRGQDVGAMTTGRGQDIAAQEANMGNQTTQRGQDIQAQIAQNNITAQKQQSLLNLALGGLTRVTPSLSY